MKPIIKTTDMNPEQTARMAAAAPELYDALRHMIYGLEDMLARMNRKGDLEYIACVREARAALAKAAGDAAIEAEEYSRKKAYAEVKAWLESL